MTRRDYTIRCTRLGLTVSSPFPAHEIGPIVDLGEALGFDICDGLVAQYLGVALAITSRELSDEWRSSLGIELPKVGDESE